MQSVSSLRRGLVPVKGDHEMHGLLSPAYSHSPQEIVGWGLGQMWYGKARAGNDARLSSGEEDGAGA